MRYGAYSREYFATFSSDSERLNGVRDVEDTYATN